MKNYKVKLSGRNQGLTLEPESKDEESTDQDQDKAPKYDIDLKPTIVPEYQPKQVDLDADFRPQIDGVINTGVGDGGDYENTSGDYD